MRISGGEFSGRIIKGSPGEHVRPTTDRTRESFFNILQNRLDFSEIRVLDLFAGTGIMALEFLSRGANEVLSLDLNMKSVRFMQQLRKDFGVENKWNIQKGNALSFIKQANLTEFDILFADPPYKWAFYDELVQQVLEKSKPDTLFCLEHDSNKLFSHPLLTDSKKYGQSVISFFQK